ncbi:MAG: RiPP maturation radical SAM protein 1 [Verrucomicrobia bacterium]|nr:RiPP maturation radical SAM protein 1 [Verrucomicrobiota bacterium]
MTFAWYVNAQRMTAADAPVCLVCMPYVSVAHPSIALGILHAALKNEGIGCRTLYANLWFAEQIGISDYSFFQLEDNLLLRGEWTFSRAAFPNSNLDSSKYLARVVAESSHLSISANEMPAFLARIRDEAENFVSVVAAKVLAQKPRIVGCTTTFQQNCASLALLRRVKELDPSVICILGGANCEVSMGEALLTSCSFLDLVVSGEADTLFAPLCHQLLTTDEALYSQSFPLGVLSRTSRKNLMGSGKVPRAVVERMDDAPIPDYYDYFSALESSSLKSKIHAGMTMESSRGCWWGQKHHCTFCGLNGGSMKFRSKSPARVLDECRELARRHGNHRIHMADNILDMSYFESVLPELAKLDPPLSVFYETKANLSRNQVNSLAQAGVRFIQPGIESLDDNVLKLMDKGATGFINIQLLKWAKEEGIFVVWYFLTHFPGEKDSWYQEMSEWLPLIHHLQPPMDVFPVQVHRFSQYHSRPEQYGLGHLRPHEVYRLLYPLPEDTLERLAYYFEFYSPKGEPESGRSALKSSVRLWWMLWHMAKAKVAALEWRTDNNGQPIIYDSRPCALEREVRLEPSALSVLEACVRAIGTSELERRFADSMSDVTKVLDDLCRRRLLLRQGNRYLSLVNRQPVRSYLPMDECPSGSILNQ